MTGALHSGPWVVVAGGHRSGTSAITGALVALGLQGVDPADRMEWSDSNPEHWESLAAAVLDEQLLEDMGGTWDAPPPDGLDVPTSERSRATAIMAAAYPGPEPPVWKDPRACLLLPFWREVLPQPLTAIFIWRHPTAVAASLERRDNMPSTYGLALWERYIRSAAAGLLGVDTYVLDYGDLITDPTSTLTSLAQWLGSLERFTPWATNWDVAAAVASVDAELSHQPTPEEGAHRGDAAIAPDASLPDASLPEVALPEVALPADTRSLVTWLTEQSGAHAPFSDPVPPAVSAWPEAMIAVRRQQSELQHLRHIAGRATEMERQLREGYQAEIDLLVAEVQAVRHEARVAISALEQATDSLSWRLTAPLRTVADKLRR